jgi:hypothetical protein
MASMSGFPEGRFMRAGLGKPIWRHYGPSNGLVVMFQAWRQVRTAAERAGLGGD